jgi:hypothetical protein
MTNRDLLELAALAAGYDTKHQWNKDRLLLEPVVDALFVYDKGELLSTGWNPLEDDGHALRLAIKLDISVDADLMDKCTYVTFGFFKERQLIEDHGDDPYAATRRAIVHAAARLGASKLHGEQNDN